MRSVIRMLIASLALACAPSAHAQDRYELAGGCYRFSDAAAGDQPLRLQATALGRYLLYRPDGTFVTAAGPAAEPSGAADFAVTEGVDGAFTLTAAEGGGTFSGRFTPADGCATFPEAERNFTGTPQPAKDPFRAVGGIVEGHMHWMTYEYFGGAFHCGRPWHPYGITRALPDCSEIEGPQGTAAPFQNTFNFGNPVQPHDTRGYPQLTEWRRDNLTYEGTYWRWVERAWAAGLRLMVMGVNENRVICQLQASQPKGCNEMDTMRRGFKAIKDLQDYVDAQAGGPGKGFFQIVTDPIQAREVINQGRMAVILEIETSEPFDCRGWENPTCDRAQVDRQLDEMYDLGVRSMLLLNKFDNPLTGVRFDSGPFGYVINHGNRESAGSFWSARTCRTQETDNELFNPDPTGSMDALVTGLGFPAGSAPAYPPAPHCNTRGLTQLGKHVVRRMMDKGMIVNPDHMSQEAVDDTLTLLETRRYSGVISPHGWMDPGNYPRLWKLGGMAFTGHTGAKGYVEEWKQFRPQRTPFKFGWGYGADLGGLSEQPAAGGEGSVGYPFESYDGQVEFDRQKTGERTFDYPSEGVAHYGLYPEWFADLNRLGGEQMARDMWEGAEAYLQMWERATGIRARGCAPRVQRLRKRGSLRIRLGAGWPALLRRAGQPATRTRLWSYCVKGKRNAGRADVALLAASGEVRLAGSTARGRRAGAFRVGARSRRALRVRRVGARAFVAYAPKGRIRAVAVTRREATRRRAALRRSMARLVRARAPQRRPAFQASETQQARAARTGSMLTGRTLAGSQNEELNAKLAFLCGLST